MARHWPRIALAVICMVLVAGSTAAMAQMMEPLIDEVFTRRDRDMLLPVAGGILVIFVVKGVSTYFQAVLMGGVGRQVIAELQSRMFGQLMQADLASFHANSSGTLVSRFTYDVQQLYGAVSAAITGIGKDGLTVIALVTVMVLKDWHLALIALCLFPLAVVPINRLGRGMRKVSSKTQNEFGQLAARLTQVFQGIRHVKAYSAERREMAHADRLIWHLARLALRAQRIRSASSPIMESLAGLAIVGVVLYGGTKVIEGERTAGAFFAFITALLLAYEPLKRLANMNATLQQGLAAADRVFKVIDTKPAIFDRPGALRLGRTQGHLTLHKVCFRYSAEVPALDDITIDIPAGHTVALVGPSGSGKSTLLNLIPRFYDVDRGAVLIDGHDVRDVSIASLRGQIALVSQEVTLFDDSVRTNIAYSRPDAGEDMIIAAARAAAAHDFIMALPEGYDTLIGEHGVRLSGGQRQRLSIARAMLKDAPILLLDEATSALDTESERLVQDALQRLMSGRTTVVIAHRLSTISTADRIFVLANGRLAEAGSHGALIARDGLYARLWRLQTDPAEAARGPSAPAAMAGV